jgi:serine/threonine-protein kinase RsbW
MVSDLPSPSPLTPLNPLSAFTGQDCHQLNVCTVGDAGLFMQQFVADLAAAGFTEKEAFGIRLAVEEAVINGIKHGNANDPQKQVRIQYSVTPQQVLVSIEDEGPGFNPDAVPNPLAIENLERPSGRGVFLMRCYMTWVQFNQRGNAVTMCKKKS